jgi:hypothetical protein
MSAKSHKTLFLGGGMMGIFSSMERSAENLLTFAEMRMEVFKVYSFLQTPVIVPITRAN